MMLPSIKAMAHLLRGEAHGSGIVCPGPGHSQKDRSLSVRIEPDAPDGFLVNSFAGDDPIACKDYVRERLGLVALGPQYQPRSIVRPPQRDVSINQETLRRRNVARWLWETAKPGRGTPAEAYLKSRRVSPPLWPASLRFLPANPPDHPWPALIAAYAPPNEPEPGVLAVQAADIAGVQLTFLKQDGSGKAPIEPQKRSIGRDHNMPIVLAPMTDGLALVIAEGIEDALSLHIATGLSAWAAGGASRLPSLAEAVPQYIEAVTIAADDDEAGRKGATELRDALTRRGIYAQVLLDIGGRRGKTGR